MRADIEQLLEREAELVSIDRVVRSTAEGDGGLVVVAGPAGIGKTRLLQAVAAAARERGFEVLSASCAELERDAAFRVALDLFEPRLRRGGEDEAAALLSGGAAFASPLFGGTQPAADDAADSRGAADRLLHGLTWLCANLAEQRPLALLVDDVHWADELSLRFLLHLARRLDGLGVLLAVAMRPNEPGAHADLIERLLAQERASLLRPRPLTAGAVASVVESWAPQPPDPVFVDACAETTGGNPLLLRELLQALGEEHVAPDPGGAERARTVGPQPVARAISLVLRRLRPGATELARAVAVLGDAVDLRAAAKLARLELEEAGAAAAELEEAELLDAEGTLQYVHPIVRASVYGQLRASERALMHRSAALILDGHAPLETVASHLVAAAPAGDGWAVTTLRRAAQQALGVGGTATAVAALRRALAEPPPAHERAAVLAELGAAEAAAGLPEAVTTFEQALALTEDPRERARLELARGTVLLSQARYAEAAAAFDAGAALVPDAGDELRLELESGWVGASLWLPSGAPAALERVAPLLAPGAEPRTPGQRRLLAQLAGAQSLRGEDRDRTVEWATRAWGGGAMLADVPPDDPAIGAVTGALSWADEFALAEHVATAVVDAARRLGSEPAFVGALFLRGGNHLSWGRLTDAIADLERAAEGRQVGWELYLPRAAGMLAKALLLTSGGLERAERVLEIDDTFDDTVRASPLYASFLTGRARVHLARGRVSTALDDLLRAGRMATDELGLANPCVEAWRSDAAIALARLGRHAEALELAEEELEHANRWGAPSGIGMALRARGIVGGRQGAEDLSAAVEMFRRSDAALEQVRAELTLGAALRAAGRRSDAREVLRSALEGADRTGATALAEEAVVELAAVGASPRRRALTGLDSLTPSERRIVGSAAAGMTNREIAESLFVTMKTVQWHLGNAYRKLGVESREALGELIAR